MLKINKRINIESLFSAFESTRDPSFSVAGERHNFWELVYLVDGVVGVAEDDKIYKLKKNDIIFHMPMEFHRIWAEDGTSPRFLIVSFASSVSFFDVLGEGIFTLDEKLELILREVLDNATYAIEFDAPIKNHLAAVNLEKLLLLLLDSQTPNTHQLKTKGSVHYKKIVKFMSENLDKNLSSEEIASMCNLSLSNLKKIFKAFSGIGVMDYFNNLKITRAMAMIDEGMAFSEISESLGFSSPNYFSECFKKRCGITPSAFKRRFTCDKGGFYQNRLE